MAPATTTTAPLEEAQVCEHNQSNGHLVKDLTPCEKCVIKNEQYKPGIQWPELLALSSAHLGCLYGIYLLLTVGSFKSFIWVFLSVYISGLGITAGAHRLWSHRSYRAKWPLRLLLVLIFTISGQRHAYAWALDHRVHHKFSETDADPHDVRRGFWFAHVGWLLLTPHPAVVRERKRVDMSDLEADAIVMWQKKYYVPLFLALAIGVPVIIPHLLWGEDLWASFWMHFCIRFCITLNIAFCVNSVAHLWGQRPYDKNIKPTENLAVTVAALGEGFHNYHHVFPYDYKTGELGDYTLNPTTGFIDFFASVGWATDLKAISPEMVKRRMSRTGDGTKAIWGWGDKDMIDLNEGKEQ